MKKYIRPQIIALVAVAVLSHSTSLAADPDSTEKVPLFLTGIILKAPDVSTCNQGKVKWLVQHIEPSTKKSVQTRLSAKNKKTEEFLDKTVGKRTRVVVAGYLTDGVEGPQCDFLDCYYAGVADEVLQELEKKQQ